MTTINLSDLSNSPYLVSNEFVVGTILPAVEIERVVMEDVPVPNSTKKNRKAVLYFKGATKGWCVNTTEGRKIGQRLGATKDLGRTWIGARIQLIVVGDVRRPDGSKGNAFRVHDVQPAATPPAPAPT